MADVLYYTLIAVGVLAGILALIAILGLFLPKSHQVARSITLKAAPEVIWRVVTDFPSVTTWHAGVEKVERLADENGHEIWRETFAGGYPMRLETLEAIAPRRLVRAITDETGPFAGRWEFDIAPIENGSRLTLTEYGEIANPFFRCMARLFMNPAMYVEIYLKALAGKFKEPTIVGK